jgi:glucan-binding YG repeat protein
MVSETNFEKHLQKQHSPEAEKRRLEKKEANKQKLEEGKKIIKCDICGIKVAQRNIEKHHKKVHSSSDEERARKQAKNAKKRAKEKAIRDQKHRKKYPNATMRDMTPEQQRRHLNKLLGPDHDPSEDIFDKGKTVQGGGYGLGKNSKH